MSGDDHDFHRLAPETQAVPKLTLAYLDPPNLRTRSPEEAHGPAMALGAKCRQCPLYGLELGPISDDPHPNPLVVIVGEHPSKPDLNQQSPLTGRTGKEVNKALANGGVGRFQTAVANTMLCSPGMAYKDLTDALRLRWKKDHFLPYKEQERKWRDTCTQLRREKIPRDQWPTPPPAPPPAPLMPHEACKPRLEQFLAKHRSAHVTLTLGKTALDVVCELEGVGRDRAKTPDDRPFAASISNQHGAPIGLTDGRKILPTYLPGRVFWKEKKHWMPVIQNEIKRAATIARRGGHIEWVEPPLHLHMGPDEIINAIDRVIASGYLTTIDIETNGLDRMKSLIRCIQVVTRINGELFVFVIRLHHMNNDPWWPPADMERIRRAVQHMLDTVPLGAQNGHFDFTVLIERGYMTDREKPWVDSLLLHKNTEDSNLPHNLGFIARRLFDAPTWKAVDHKSVNNFDDFKLHKYGALDAVHTHRIIEALWPTVQQLGTVPQYATDYKIAPIFRQAGHMGLPIDEELRGYYSALTNRLVGERLKIFWEDGDCYGLNPKSVPQLQDLIYGVWGYSPPVEEAEDASYGHQEHREDDEIRARLLPDQDPEENRSTSSQTITALLDLQVRDEKHRKALDALLLFRGAEKIRSTYVDKLQVHYYGKSKMGFEPHFTSPVSVSKWDSNMYNAAGAAAGLAGADGWSTVVALPDRPAMSVLHTTYKQTIPTGRLASSPNCQNWPATGAVDTKAQIVAPPGHSYFGADYCQLEGRIYTAVAQDQILLDILNTDRDLHSSNVATLRAENPDRLQYWYNWAQANKDNSNIEPGESASGKLWRTIAKVFVFSLLYGAEVPSLYEFMRTVRDKKTRTLLFPDIKMPQVQRWYDQWHKFHPETKAWWAECRRFYKRHGYIAVPALDGRRRYFPGGPSKQNAVMNMMIQGFAASVMNKATLEIYDAIPFGKWSQWTGIALQVHDDLRILAPDENAEYVKSVIASCLPYSWGGVVFDIDPPEQSKRIGKAPKIWTPSEEQAAQGYRAVAWQSKLVEGRKVQTRQEIQDEAIRIRASC